MGATAIGTDILSPTDRDRILQAMADCCAERGYAETSVEMVVERAAVERVDFDSYFSDKEDCALAALNKIVSETLATVSTVPSRGSELEQRAAQIAAIAELMSTRPAFARLGYIEARQGAPLRLRDSYESAGRVLALMMERSQGAGIRPPAWAARAALGGAEALVRREIAAGRTGELKRYLPDFVYAALVPFVGQEEALRQAKAAKGLAAEEG